MTKLIWSEIPLFKECKGVGAEERGRGKRLVEPKDEVNSWEAFSVDELAVVERGIRSVEFSFGDSDET